ncbi:lamin tail domain-containing protein [Aquabacterium sp.]|uniref:lamin tail domain-containing protein n=1 Tax=Aquabacterium sp. TaxID=1872578 RepID=UPI003D6CD01C
MKAVQKKAMLAATVLALSLGATATAQAQIRVTEVAPWGSSDSNPAIPYATDWFELTNFGNSDVSISGWKMDDSSNGSAKVSLVGISTIKAGESVIFTETAASASFLSTWFGAHAPAGLQIGTYTGSGVGLSQSGDAVNLYNASNVLQANVVFGAADATSPYQTFDNAIGLNNTTITQLSVAGVNGAFAAANHAIEIGSPGSIAAVPEPESHVLALAALGLFGLIARKRQQR